MLEIFRFISFRPPEPSRTPGIDIALARSFFQKTLIQALDDVRPLDTVIGHAEEFLGSPDFVSMLEELATPLVMFGQLLKARQVRDVETLGQVSREIFDREPSEVTASDSYQEDRKNLSDSLIALTVLWREGSDLYQQLAHALRLCGLLERVTNGDERLSIEGEIERALNATIVLPEDIFPLPPVINPEVFEREGLKRIERETREREKVQKRLVRQFQNLQDALADLEGLPASAFRQPPTPKDTKLGVIIEKRKFSSPWTLSDEAISALSSSTKESLENLKIRLDVTPLPQVMSRVEHALSEVSQQLAPTAGRTTVRRVGSRFFADHPPDFLSSIGLFSPGVFGDEDVSSVQDHTSKKGREK